VIELESPNTSQGRTNIKVLAVVFVRTALFWIGSQRKLSKEFGFYLERNNSKTNSKNSQNYLDEIVIITRLQFQRPSNGMITTTQQKT